MKSGGGESLAHHFAALVCKHLLSHTRDLAVPQGSLYKTNNQRYGRKVTLPAKAGQSESASLQIQCRVACTWGHGHYWEAVEDSTEVSLLTASQLLHSHGMFTIPVTSSWLTDCFDKIVSGDTIKGADRVDNVLVEVIIGQELRVVSNTQHSQRFVLFDLLFWVRSVKTWFLNGFHWPP